MIIFKFKVFVFFKKKFKNYLFLKKFNLYNFNFNFFNLILNKIIFIIKW